MGKDYVKGVCEFCYLDSTSTTKVLNGANSKITTVCRFTLYDVNEDQIDVITKTHETEFDHEPSDAEYQAHLDGIKALSDATKLECADYTA